MRSALLCLLLALPALAEKPAWQWTDAERFAVRFAPGAAEKRYDAAGDGRHPRIAPDRERSMSQDYVDGRVNPEMLLPFEIWRDMIQPLFPPAGTPPSEFHETLVRRGTDYGFSDLRAILERANSDYRAETQKLIAKRDEILESGPRRSDAAMIELRESSSPKRCRAMADGFNNLRAELGPERDAAFLRWLYEVVAPHVIIDNVGQGDMRAWAAKVAGGCR